MPRGCGSREWLWGATSRPWGEFMFPHMDEQWFQHTCWEIPTKRKPELFPSPILTLESLAKSHQNLGQKHKVLALCILEVFKAGRNGIAWSPVTETSRRAPGQEWSHFLPPGLATSLLHLERFTGFALFPGLITPTLGFPKPWLSQWGRQFNICFFTSSGGKKMSSIVRKACPGF